MTTLQSLENVRDRNELSTIWTSSYPLSQPAVVFYGHNPEKCGLNACFSNFYSHDTVPFCVPDCCWEQFSRALDSDTIFQYPRTVNVQFSEKSIMLCKAAVMCDPDRYMDIVKANTPIQAKRLGRKVHNFDEDIWQSVLLEVAYEAVYQKFQKLGSMSEGRKYYTHLMETGNAFFVEAAPRDSIWGIGRGTSHPHCQDPRKWGRGNVLGYALIRARNKLMEEEFQQEHEQASKKARHL